MLHHGRQAIPSALPGRLSKSFKMMRRFIQFCCSALAFAAASVPACAAESSGDAEPSLEIYAGGDYDGRAGALTSSMVWSPLDPVAGPGFRIKLDGLASIYGSTNASLFSSNFLAADLKTFGDVMIGYQINYGQLWLKMYAGAAYQVQTRAFWDAGQLVQQNAWGPAAAIESFWRVSDRVWASANVSWLKPGNTASLYTRGAYEVYSSESGLKISAGAESGLTINNAGLFKEGRALDLYNNYVRAGPLLNLRYGLHDFSISGGLSQASDEAMLRPYASIRYGRQF
jgi:hypothetical protein